MHNMHEHTRAFQTAVSLSLLGYMSSMIKLHTKVCACVVLLLHDTFLCCSIYAHEPLNHTREHFGA
jgi:hypothetical protein